MKPKLLSKDGLLGTNGGAWSEETHLKLYGQNFNKGLARFISESINPKSYFEFGSGLGYLADYISKNSEADPIHCIEPYAISGIYKSNRSILFNIDIFNEPLPDEVHASYELVISVEVAEHINLKYHTYLFDYLCRLSHKWLIFSAARPNQGGHGHIAERPEHEWREEIVSRGFIFDAELTFQIRESCDEKNINHRKNLMVFQKSQ